MYLISSSYRVPESGRQFARPVDFVSLCVEAVREAVGKTGIKQNDENVQFILSTTKGDNLFLTEPAQRIADVFGNSNTPVVVSNACISGVAAQVVADRMLANKQYVVLIGCDLVTDFISSGFEALKAVSHEPCRPFDRNRQGLNLGEAVAVMILGKKRPEPTDMPCWRYVAGSIHNDANHITGPSRVGEGSYRCLTDVMKGATANDLACVSVHGTGTQYNDEMESIAVFRAGLIDVPVCGFKGVYGHTLGAAGVLETILTMHSIERGYVPATVGFTEQGTTYSVRVSSEERVTDKRQFIKLLSGFGGCNAAVRWEMLN